MQEESLIKKAKNALDDLSEEKLKVAIDFINYLKEKDEMEATLDVLSSKELMMQISEAEKTLEKDYIPWESVKQDV